MLRASNTTLPTQLGETEAFRQQGADSNNTAPPMKNRALGRGGSRGFGVMSFTQRYPLGTQKWLLGQPLADRAQVLGLLRSDRGVGLIEGAEGFEDNAHHD